MYNSGVLNTAEDIINFLELPEEYDELFAVWMEHGQPTSDEIDSWNIFFLVYNCEDGKRKTNLVYKNSYWLSEIGALFFKYQVGYEVYDYSENASMVDDGIT